MTDDDFVLVALALAGFFLANPFALGGVAALVAAPIAAGQVVETTEELIDPKRRLSPVSQTILTVLPGMWGQVWYDWFDWIRVQT